MNRKPRFDYAIYTGRRGSRLVLSGGVNEGEMRDHIARYTAKPGVDVEYCSDGTITTFDHRGRAVPLVVEYRPQAAR